MSGDRAGSPFVRRRSDGLYAYVVTTSEWGRHRDDIEWAASLKDAKERYGRTRMQYVTKTVRRARVHDLVRVAR